MVRWGLVAVASSLLGCNVVLGLEEHELSASAGACGSSGLEAAEVVVATQSSPVAVRADAASIFWANDASIQSIERAGGAQPNPLATTMHHATAIALDAANVYFTDAADNGACQEQSLVLAVKKGGGSVTQLWNSVFCGTNDPFALATDGTSVFFTVPEGQFDQNPVNAGRAVMKGDVTQQAVVILAYDVPKPKAIGLYTSFVYFVSEDQPGAGSVRRVAKDSQPDASGGQVIVSGEGMPVGIAFDSERGYVSVQSGSESRILAFDPESGTTTLLATDALGATDIAVDGTYVYWCNPATGQVLSVCKGGGPPTTIAETQGGPSGISADAVGVYWANRTSGQVMLARRK